MNYLVKHLTTFHYSQPVSLCHNEIHLAPRSFGAQNCISTMLTILPTPAVMNDRIDFFGNRVSFFTVQERHTSLEVSAISEVQVCAPSVPIPALTPPWESVRDMLHGENSHKHLDATQFLFDSYHVKTAPYLADYASESFLPGRPILEAALDLTHKIHKDFKFDSKATTLNTSVEEVFESRRGVCQDFAHLQISCLRSLHLAARYVSGYLLTAPPPGKERLVGADASHAWVSLYCPGFGWIDLDPTNDLIPSEKHVMVAWGRDYGDVSPVKGVILGGGHHQLMNVAVDVTPI